MELPILLYSVENAHKTVYQGIKNMYSLQNQNLSQKVADELRKNIVIEKLYKPGDKLPNENDLSTLLGVSRATLREAIHILVTEGVLTVYRGKGTFISTEMDSIVETAPPLMNDMMKMKITLRDLYEARLLIEPYAAGLAADRATEDEINEIIEKGEILQELIKCAPESEDRILAEIEFHGSIIKASHNEFLSRSVGLLTESIEGTFKLDDGHDEMSRYAYNDHIQIMDFLKHRDAEALKSAIIIHLHHAAISEGLM